MTSYCTTHPLAKLKNYITGRNEWHCFGVDIESSWTSPSLCDRALSHYIWLGMLTGNAVGSWVSRSGRASVSRASSPALPGSELDEGGGLVNQQQDAYWSRRPLSRVQFQISYHTHRRGLAPSLPLLFSLACVAFSSLSICRLLVWRLCSCVTNLPSTAVGVIVEL